MFAVHQLAIQWHLPIKTTLTYENSSTKVGVHSYIWHSTHDRLWTKFPKKYLFFEMTIPTFMGVFIVSE